MRFLCTAFSVMSFYAVVAACVTSSQHVASAAGSSQVNRIAVGPNVLVSAARQAQTHDEVLIAADPANPQHLIGCSIIYYTDYDSHTIVYSSFDGGSHWQPTLDAKFGRYTGDPACSFGPGNKAYFATLGTRKSSDGQEHGITIVYRSLDGGRTWPQHTILGNTDREYLTVDSVSKPYNGRVYLNAAGYPQEIDEVHDYGESSGLFVYRSPTGSTSFEPVTRLTDTDSHYILGVGNAAVLSDGSYVAVFGDLKKQSSGWNLTHGTATAWLKTVSSKDGGQHFDKAVVVDDWEYCNITTSGAIPVIAADHTGGPFRDRLYAVWPAAKSGRCELYLSHSSDKGKSWSAPVTVNDDYASAGGKSPNDFMPTVAVNNAGVVGISWYDRRDSANDNAYWVRFSASLDGGETFSPSVRVSSAPSDLDRGRRLVLTTQATGGGNTEIEGTRSSRITATAGTGGFSFNGGHTAGMAAAADGVFHPLWVDNRTGRPQVWTATVGVMGRAIKNGSDEFSSYDDVSTNIRFQFANVRFDRSSAIASADAYVYNKSDSPIQGPIVVRALRLTSGLGHVSVLGADNGLEGPGAVWEFSSQLEGGVLAAKTRSGPKHLAFSVRNLTNPRIIDGKVSPTDVLQVQTAILGPKKPEKETAK